MATGRFVAYYRVSTKAQGGSGLGLEAQRGAVLAYLNGDDWSLLAEFTEVESGKHNDRAQLRAALARCKLTGATLVIAKLDRLSRNVAFLANLMDSGVEFVACDNPTATRFTLHILAAVAEQETAMISARTKAALAAAKPRGTRLGGFRGTVNCDHAKATAGRVAQADAYAARVAPIAKGLRAKGLSLRQIATELTATHVATANGGAWSAEAVSRLLARTTTG